jgi:hypothetical protein
MTEGNLRDRKKAALAAQFQAGQLALWPDAERGIPNELVRCSVFSAKNRKEKRKDYPPTSPLRVPILGTGEPPKGWVEYIGQELRQDDETVWMQLIHMAKEARSETVTFTPYSFIQTIRWPDKGDSYKRLFDTLRRLQTSSLTVYSELPDRGATINLIRDFKFALKDRSKPWSVNVFSSDHELLFLFDKLMYSRLEWETRLALPEGASTWLHAFFASHRDPYGYKVEKLAKGAGLKLDSPEDAQLEPIAREAKRKERLREAKKTIKQALEDLVSIGFLESFKIIRNEKKEDVVHVVRAARPRAPATDL